MTKILNNLKSIHEIIKDVKPSKVCLITSKQLASKLGWAIKEIGVPKLQTIFLPDGESAKEWSVLETLLKKLSKLNLDRRGLIIVLGGGTIGDVSGFAASIYLRGVKYIQVPTTLVAQVDSAHGAKTGVNFHHYKNQVGSFYLPIATIVDPRFLESLSRELIIDGLGEIIKAGFIRDTSILSLLQNHTVETLKKSSDLEKIIHKSIAVKNYYIRQDFLDNGSRQVLNVGHTFGHAVELKYKISHGRAVLIGMIQEFKLAESLKMSPPSLRKNLEKLLDSLNIKLDCHMIADWQTVLHDKKISGQTIAFPIVESIGKSKVIELDLKLLRKF